MFIFIMPRGGIPPRECVHAIYICSILKNIMMLRKDKGLQEKAFSQEVRLLALFKEKMLRKDKVQSVRWQQRGTPIPHTST